MAEYKTIKSISQGLTTLALKQRIDLDYHCIVWRQKRLESNTNRRFYLEAGSFWSMPADLALKMLNKANDSNLLSSRYFRWPDREIEVLDTAKLSKSKRQALINETLVASDEDQVWRNCEDLRIVACCEPWEYDWRKVMVVSKNENLATFRSLTRADYYTHVYQFDLQNGWKLDRTMVDADGKIHEIHLKALREIMA